MTMYSSRPPFSRDRYPYRNKYDGSRWADPGVDTRGNTVIYDPRAEKGEFPKHNLANPVLIKFREIPDAFREAWRTGFLAAAEHVRFAAWSDDEADHAVRVLSRLSYGRIHQDD